MSNWRLPRLFFFSFSPLLVLNAALAMSARPAMAQVPISVHREESVGSDNPGDVAKQAGLQRAALDAKPLWIVAYPGPPVDQVTLRRYREIADAGIDVVVPANGSWDGKPNIKALDLAAQVGLRVIVADLRILPWHKSDRVGIDPRKIEAVVADYAKHPALLAYLVCDEPNVSYFKDLAATSESLRTADARHPPLINLFPSYGSPKQLGFKDYRAYVRAFIKTVKPDILSYDHYPLREPHAGTTDWHGDLAIIRDEARKAGIPFWICLQSEGIKGGLRVPNRAEILWQASTALAYGVRGVVWFTYWTPSPTQEIPPDKTGEEFLVESHVGGMLSHDGKRTPRYNYVREANGFLHQVGRSLAGWDNVNVARWKDGNILDGGHSPCIELRGKQLAAVVGTFSQDDVCRVVIANDSFSESASFSIKPLPGWRFTRVVASLEAATTSDDTKSHWKLAPGGCVVIQCERKM